MSLSHQYLTSVLHDIMQSKKTNNMKKTFHLLVHVVPGNVCPQDLEQLRETLKILHVKFQEPGEMSEDCLFLNIFTPSLDPGAKLPVMFWIHGGGFILGGFHDGMKPISMWDICFLCSRYTIIKRTELCALYLIYQVKYMQFVDTVNSLMFARHLFGKFRDHL